MRDADETGDVASYANAHFVADRDLSPVVAHLGSVAVDKLAHVVLQGQDIGLSKRVPPSSAGTRAL